MTQYDGDMSHADSVGRGEGEPFSDVHVLDLLIIIAKYKKIVLGVPLLVGLLAAVVSVLLPSVYTATVKILPPQQNQTTAASMLAQLGLLTGVSGPKNSSEIYIAMLKSRRVLDNVARRLNLKDAYGTDTPEELRTALRGRTTVTIGKDSVISVDYDDTDPQRAAAVANACVEELHVLSQSFAVTEASQRRLFFERQLKMAKEGLNNAEIALRQLQETTGLIRLDEQGKSAIETVARIRAEIAAKEVQVFAMRSFATEQNAEYVHLLQQLAGLRAQLAKFEKANPDGSGDTFIAAKQLPKTGLDYVRKLRDLKYYETIFDLMAKQFELAKVDEARDASLIQILEEAIPPERRARPRRTLIVVVSVLVATFLTMLAVFVWEAMKRTYNDGAQAARFERLRDYLRAR